MAIAAARCFRKANFAASTPLPIAVAVWYNARVPMKGGEIRHDSDR